MFINLNNLIAEIRRLKRIEQEIPLTNSMKTIAFTKKWVIINSIIPKRSWIVLNKQIFKKKVNCFWKFVHKNGLGWEGITFFVIAVFFGFFCLFLFLLLLLLLLLLSICLFVSPSWFFFLASLFWCFHEDIF